MHILFSLSPDYDFAIINLIRTDSISFEEVLTFATLEEENVEKMIK